MLVSVSNKVLLLDAANSNWILPVLPHAKEFRNDGKNYLVVPHRIDEAIVLRNIGYAAPSPIEYHYKWPGRFRPFKHQIVTSAFLTLNPRAFVLNDIGTGKTLSAYWAADYLMSLGLVRRVLVVSPLSTLERVHGDALFQNLPHRSFTILHGTAAKRRDLATADFDFYIINHDGVEVIAKILAARSDIDLVIIDELAAYRNGQTSRWKALKGVLQPRQRVWGMTGTPTPNEPTDAYAQVKLVRPGVVAEYSSFTQFKMATMVKVSMFKFVPKPDAMDRVHAIMQPAVRFNRDECLDLPECLYETRDIELTPAQRKAYREMLNNLVTQVNGGQITALNEAIKLMRLMQVVSGVAYDTKGDHQQIDCAPRLAAVKEIIEEAGQKVIVFVPFQGNLTTLKTALDKYTTSEVVYGLTSVKDRNDIFYRFQNMRDPQVLIAHPGCMSHGLNLQAASTIIWWAPVNSNDIYTQANGRINRSGQKNAMTVFHLASTKIERDVYKRLETKQKLQGILLDLVQQQEK